MDNKLFHKLIRQQRGKLNRVIDELHVGDSVFKTDTEILIGWRNHFANLAKESDRMDFDHGYLDTVDVNVYFFCIIFILTRKNIIIINIPQSKYYVIILPYP